MGEPIMHPFEVQTCVNPKNHVSSRSGVATLRTAIHLLLTATATATATAAITTHVVELLALLFRGSQLHSELRLVTHQNLLVTAQLVYDSRVLTPRLQQLLSGAVLLSDHGLQLCRQITPLSGQLP